MAGKFSLYVQAPPIGILPAAADAAGRTSGYRSLRNILDKVAIVCRVNQGNAAQVTFTPMQAQDDLGTGAKPLANAVPVFYNADTASSDVLVPQSYATDFQTDANLADKIVMFEFQTSELDLANGFGHIAIQTSASNAANVTSAEMIGILRFQQQVPPSTLV